MTSVFPNIALMGRARSGKDTIAQHLISRFCYTRVAFADPLKEMALSIDPLIPHMRGKEQLTTRLSRVVEIVGWERAKDDLPEVRRFLINLGTSVRDQDIDFWARLGLDKVTVAQSWGLPVVITDVRFPNEYHALKNRGFKMVRVIRPGLPDTPYANDDSETGLDNEFKYPTNAIVANAGTLDDLRNLTESLASTRPE